LAGGLAAIQAGQWVQVWGQLDSAGGRTVATRVGLAAGAQAWVVRGVLASLDSSAGRIGIGSLQATLAAGSTGVIPAGLQVGDVVRARLSPAWSAEGRAVLLALRGDALQVPDRVSAELEGRITRIDSALSFAVDGVTVQALGASAAAAAAQLSLGARVAVAGRSVQGVFAGQQRQDRVRRAGATGGRDHRGRCAARQLCAARRDRGLDHRHHL